MKPTDWNQVFLAGKVTQAKLFEQVRYQSRNGVIHIVTDPDEGPVQVFVRVSVEQKGRKDEVRDFETWARAGERIAVCDATFGGYTRKKTEQDETPPQYVSQINAHMGAIGPVGGLAPEHAPHAPAPTPQPTNQALVTGRVTWQQGNKAVVSSGYWSKNPRDPEDRGQLKARDVRVVLPEELADLDLVRQRVLLAGRAKQSPVGPVLLASELSPLQTA